MSNPSFEVRVREDGGPLADEGGRGDALRQERASATPTGAIEGVGGDRGASDTPGVEGPLERLQTWFADVMTAPDGVQSGLQASEPVQRELGAERVEAIVRPNDRLSAAERMAIYNQAYHSRLVGCVMDDFEGVGEALGAEAFETACLRYVQQHPSRGPDLNVYAGDFAGFVGTQGDLGVDPAFLSDLARLEWAMIEVLHAPIVPPIDMSPLAAAPPEAWATVRLLPSPCLRVLELDYPANKWFQATREGVTPPIPAPQPTITAVYRQQWRIWRMDFTPTAAAVVQSLLRGAPLGEALAAVADTEAGPDGTDVQKWFQEWVSSGFFSRLEM